MQTVGHVHSLTIVGPAAAVPLAENGNALGQPPAAARMALADWPALLVAVTARLQQVGSSAGGANLRATADLLECAQALGQLHDALATQDGGRRRLELELFDARMALALAQSVLAGLRDGERRARHDAQHDALTSLPNRQHFRERLHQALAATSGPRGTLAVLYIDLDDFKPVNDLHGHATGDELLRIVATRLTRAVRAEDMVSRLGGDEFACLIADMPNPAGLDTLTRKLIAIVSAPVTLGALKLRVRPSIGIAVSPPDATSADELLRCADAAMYRAKRTKTGSARFDPLIDDPRRVSIPSQSA